MHLSNKNIRPATGTYPFSKSIKSYKFMETKLLTNHSVDFKHAEKLIQLIVHLRRSL